MVRATLDQQFAAEVRAIRPWADGVLTQSYTIMKRHGVASKTWWQLNSDVAALVLPTSEVGATEILAVVRVRACGGGAGCWL